jgi:hypothetical protein
MQAPGRIAKSAACAAVKMLIAQDDFLEIVSVPGECLRRLRRTALVNNRVANLGRKAFDVMRMIAVFALPKAAATFR